MTDVEYERIMHKIEVLTEKCENARLQAGHAESIVVSERRQWDRINEGQKRDRVILDKHEKALYNDGRGLIYEVRMLYQDKKNSNETLYKWLTIISVACTVGMAIFTIVTQNK